MTTTSTRALLCSLVLVMPVLPVRFAAAHHGHEHHDGPGHHHVHGLQEDQEARPDDADPNTPRTSIVVRGDHRYIVSNGLPDHETGRFPNRGNPNRITAQDHRFRVPVKPVKAARPVPVGMSCFGVAVNGVFFEAGTAEWWNNDRNSGWHIEAIGGTRNLGLDSNKAHVQPNGAYHYHAVPDGLVKKLAGDQLGKAPLLIGWAADGHPIYGPWGYEDPDDPQSEVRLLQSSWKLRKGQRPAAPEGPGGMFDGTYEEDHHFVAGSGDLDQFNGRTGVTPEFPDGTYYYVVTDQFPFVSRSWRGMPDDSFTRKGRSHGQRPGGSRRGPGRQRPGGEGARDRRDRPGPPGGPPRRPPHR